MEERWRKQDIEEASKMCMVGVIFVLPAAALAGLGGILGPPWAYAFMPLVAIGIIVGGLFLFWGIVWYLLSVL